MHVQTCLTIKTHTPIQCRPDNRAARARAHAPLESGAETRARRRPRGGDMRLRSHLASGSVMAMAAALGLAAGPAFAQTSAEADVEEVVVTGTLIAGAMKTGALPV